MSRPSRARYACVAVLVAMFALALPAARADVPPSPRLLGGYTMDARIPSPEQVLGLQVGSRPLRHAEIVRYFEALAGASPRAKMLTYGHTYEGRPIFALAVGDEETVRDLDRFREEHVRAMDPRGRAAAADKSVLASRKAVAWMGYGVHGGELSSSDAAVLLAYWLVAGTDTTAQAIRREVLVLIDPAQNPDGRERQLSQTTAFAHAVPSPDPADISHRGSWPWGRGNHYLFDLNRDWMTLVQPESARSPFVARWCPQLVVDAHEMEDGSTYLFSPPRAPFNPFRAVNETKWRDTFAGEQATALDAHGYAYFTGEWNEEFFPGYGSSIASYMGSIGILYEMSGTAGTLVQQREGVVRTFAQAVDHQLTSSIANLVTLSAHRAEIMADQVEARRGIVARGTSGPLRAWILDPGTHADRTDALAHVLRALTIEVHRLGAPVKVDDLHDIRSGAVAARELPAGAWLIPLDQPNAALARVLLDPHVPMPASFLREQREYLERGKGSRLYDATGWSLPLAYGVDAYWTAKMPAGDWRRDGEPAVPAGHFVDAPAAYGYLVDGAPDRSATALADLLQRGIAVRVAEKPFRVGQRDFKPGTLLVKREGNPADLATIMAGIAQRHALDVVATPTAKAASGPDLGGTYFHPLLAPRVGVITGFPVSGEDYGWTWHLLDTRLGLRFTAIDIASFGGVDLARYNTLIFSPAWGGRGYQGLLGPNGLDRLRRWIEAGGTAIGIGEGAELLADKAYGLTATRLRSQALDRYPPAVLGVTAADAASAGLPRADGLRPDPPVPERDAKEKLPTPVKDEGPRRASPYDIAPVLGPGAQPFAAGVEQGTPAGAKVIDLATWMKPLLPVGKEKPEPADLERADARLRLFAPQGALLRVELDRDVWLDWGLGEALDAFVDASDTLVAEPPVQVAARFAKPDRLQEAGLLWPEAAGRLANTAYATRERVGRGQVILFLAHPAFRRWTVGTERLLTNAILFGPGLGTDWSAPW